MEVPLPPSTAEQTKHEGPGRPACPGSGHPFRILDPMLELVPVVLGFCFLMLSLQVNILRPWPALLLYDICLRAHALVGESLPAP